ncbi:hypothetical protein C2E23DRAFT_882733 [Lenzites betulinus]|nr:hypothetical protein C2E23DRAFT_882733 [Lenzites betulinus]
MFFFAVVRTVNEIPPLVMQDTPTPVPHALQDSMSYRTQIAALPYSQVDPTHTGTLVIAITFQQVWIQSSQDFQLVLETIAYARALHSRTSTSLWSPALEDATPSVQYGCGQPLPHPNTPFPFIPTTLFPNLANTPPKDNSILNILIVPPLCLRLP